ncbi:MAG TPA: metalloregulator ArsR/SmtB family transcription factor [Ktedonobacteraceae bacterium]
MTELTRPLKTAQHADADIFTALAHPVRRAMLDQLTEGERPVAQLAGRFGMTRPAISQHLRILREVGVVSEQRHGRQRYYRLHPERLYEVQAWLQKYDRFWQKKLEMLGEYLEETHEQ